MTIEPKFSAQAWPAAKVEMWAVENLVPYVRNARQHPPEQIDQIAASMETVRLHHPDAGGRRRHRDCRPSYGTCEYV